MGFSDDSEKEPFTPLDEKFLRYDGVGALSRPSSVDSLNNIVTKALHADDDPSLNPWTFRMWFIGEYYIELLSFLSQL
jgi:hypothetical protein